MKLCILGPEKKKDFHLRLIEISKYKFGKVLYAPLSGVRIEKNGDDFLPYYKSASLLDFDVVFLMVPPRLLNFGYTISTILEKYRIFTPVSSLYLSYASNPFMTFLLNAEIMEIESPSGIYLSTSRDALNAVLPKLRYPVRVYMPEMKKGGSAIFESESSLKTFLDTMELFSQPIMIEEIGKNVEDIDVLVIGTRIHSIKNGKPLRKTPNKVKEVVTKISSALHTSVFQASLSVENSTILIKKLKTSLRVDKFEEHFGKDITQELINYLHKGCSEHYRRYTLLNLIDRMVDTFKSVAKAYTLGGKRKYEQEKGSDNTSQS